MIPCVYGVKDEPLNGEFCVFDTETTGDVYKRQGQGHEEGR